MEDISYIHVCTSNNSRHMPLVDTLCITIIENTTKIGKMIFFDMVGCLIQEFQKLPSCGGPSHE